MRIIKDTNIQFMSQYKLGAFLSGTVIILGIISLILAGGPLLSIDFKGGTLIAVHFEEPVDVNEFRSAMSNVNIEGQSFDLVKLKLSYLAVPRISLYVFHIWIKNQKALLKKLFLI